MSISRAVSIWATAAAFLALPILAQRDRPVAPRVTGAVDETKLHTLPGDTHPLARPEFDRGAAPVDLPMDRMLLLLSRTPEQEVEVEQLIEQQQTPGSPNYHRWLTPQQFGERFGAAPEDIEQITRWLSEQGFRVDRVAHGRGVVEFSGTAAQVTRTFHTEIHRYLVNGEEHWANAQEPRIPAALATVIAGIVSLDDFPAKALHHSRGAVRRQSAAGPWIRTADSPQFTYPMGSYTFHLLSPYDFATIYNVLPLWTKGLDGAGQTIAIAGRSNISLQDVRNFRSLFGLPARDPVVTLNGPDPGTAGKDDETENVLDVEWAGAVAKAATVNLVVSKTTTTTDGVDLSMEYIVDRDLAPVLSTSYGQCEKFVPSRSRFFSNVWQQAAAQGITVVVAAGDQGSAVCDAGGSYARFGLQVNGLASTPYNVAVGGTDFSDGASRSESVYWNSTNAAGTNASAKSYVPEMTWNETCASPFISSFLGWPDPETLCNDPRWPLFPLSSGSGGASTVYSKPPWQSGVYGVPADGHRDLPDVSLFASTGSFWDTAYPYCQADQQQACDPDSSGGPLVGIGGGDSFGAPAFAGIMALIDQKTGSRQGLANPALYTLASLEYGSPGNVNSGGALACNAAGALAPDNTCMFYDVTTGTNDVPCLKGSPDCMVNQPSDLFGLLSSFSKYFVAAYAANVGYDLATGLGSVNAANLVNNWPASACCNQPVLNISNAHTGHFEGGAAGIYTVTLANSGSGPTSGTVVVTEMPPAWFSNIHMWGAGWNCAANTCSRSDVLNPGSVYPVIYASADVAPSAPPQVVNQTTVSGGGSAQATASDPTTITRGTCPVTISKTHLGSFSAMQTGIYTLVVTNPDAHFSSSGVVKVTENVPTGLTLFEMSGSGWDCAGSVCTRSDALGPSASYPPITVTVNVVLQMPSQVTNQATVSVGGSATSTASDPTTIIFCCRVPTTTTLVASPSTIKASESTTLSATVTSSRPGWEGATVSFYLGSSLLSSSTPSFVNNRVSPALLIVNGSQLAVGSNSLTAVFQGSSGDFPSISSPVIVTVTPAPLVPIYTISTVAGTGTQGFGGDGGPAISAALNRPEAVAVDPGGARYIADMGNHRIRLFGPSGTIGTFAGNGIQGFGGDDGLAISASLNEPGGIAPDGAGNVFIADGGNHRIRRVTAAGIISTIAGNGTEGFSGDGGPATSAALAWPRTVAVDAAGNLFIADTENNRIRKVTTAGIISTVAGSGATGVGTGGFGGDGGPATAAELHLPTAVAVDGAGNLFIADSENHRIRRVTAAGTISTIAGNGSADFSGDGGHATAAALHWPSAVAVDATGNLFIGDEGNARVRKVDLTGAIATVAGNGDLSFEGDGGPALWAALDPAGIAIDNSGHVLIADSLDNRIRQVTLQIIGSPPPPPPPSLAISKTHSGSYSQGQAGVPYIITVSNGAAGSPTAGRVTVTENPSTGLNPGSMAGDGWTCSAVICLRNDALALGASYPPIRVTMDVAPNAPSQVTNQATVSGGGSPPATASDVANINPNNSPIPTATTLTASAGTIGTAGSTTLIATVIANGSGTPAGAVSFNAGSALLGSAPLIWGGSAAQATLAVNGSQLVSGQNSIAASYAGNAQYASSASSPVIVTVTQQVSAASGYTIATVAGSASKGFGGDGGPATAAALSMPGAVAVDGAGNLLIVDWGNHRIRKVTPAGIVDTIAGSGKAGFSGDGGPATSAALNQPSYVALDGAGNIFIADQLNNRIRKVSAAGIISTVAGSGTPGFSGDSGPATSAALSQPAGVAVDAAGNLFIADYGNNRVRIVSPAGTIATIAGNGTAGFSGDGEPATLAALDGPTSVAVDGSGSLFIADYGNNRIRKVNVAGAIDTVAGSGAAGFSGGGFSGDGGPATLAMLNGPSDVAVDATGRLFIADSFNARIRMVDRASAITTVAGDGNWGFAGDSGPAMAAEFEFASGVALDRAGDIFIADLGNSRIRKLTPVSGPQIGMAGSTPGVFNAATLQTGGIAPNEFISVKGAGLGPASGAISPGMSAQLGGSSVSIGGTTAYVTYTQDGQINALVPFNVAGSQSTTIQVTYNGVAGNTVTVPVVDSSPGIFTQSYGPGQAWIVNQDGTFNSPTNAAPRGTYVAFWVTGQGLVDTALADGVQPGGPTYPTPMLPLSVSLGDVAVPAANVVFDGLIYSGEVQVNLLIPVNAPTGNAVPLVVTMGGASSRADATIAIQ